MPSFILVQKPDHQRLAGSNSLHITCLLLCLPLILSKRLFLSQFISLTANFHIIVVTTTGHSRESYGNVPAQPILLSTLSFCDHDDL